ncbi:MAG: hypothetical protein ACLQFR_09645 [Streptosporangiaceae bacterium]
MAVASSTLVVAAMGVAWAGTASASASPNYMCVNANDGLGDECAFDNNVANSNVEADPPGAPYASDEQWFYPTSPTSYGKIRQSGGNFCMQLDHAAGNVIIEATCSSSSPSYQEWLPEAAGQGVLYISEWQANPTLCLTYNADEGYLDAVKCNKSAWYQQFFN